LLVGRLIKRIKTIKLNTIKFYSIPIIVLISLLALTAVAQEQKPGCNPSSCGPGDTKKSEAKVITTMRNDLQLVITKMAKANKGFNQNVTGLQISAGSTDDESLLFIYQSSAAVKAELISKLASNQVLPALRENATQPLTSKQQMVASLQGEIELLTTQVEKL
jgi:hypothetical protein